MFYKRWVYDKFHIFYKLSENCSFYNAASPIGIPSESPVNRDIKNKMAIAIKDLTIKC
jgi:NAD kinase